MKYLFIFIDRLLYVLITIMILPFFVFASNVVVLLFFFYDFKWREQIIPLNSALMKDLKESVSFKYGFFEHLVIKE